MTRKSTGRKTSWTLLIVFSAVVCASGIAWACAWYEGDDSSVFSPEYFVDNQYSPFFYDGENRYYSADEEDTGTPDDQERFDNNARYNRELVKDWDGYLNHQLPQAELKMLLFETSRRGLDSVQKKLAGASFSLPAAYARVISFTGDAQKLRRFISYLLIARRSESFAVRDVWYGWDDKPVVKVDATLEDTLKTALQQEKDSFIQQRLLFQLIRYYYFQDRYAAAEGGKTPVNANSKILALFSRYENTFPKNLMYYRTLGYVAGYYYYHGGYGTANYLYSLGYNYSLDMKIPGKWSFHPQEEADWNQTLQLAKSAEEKVVLWHMLGMEYDPARAIQEILTLDTKTDKADLLLTRLINMQEAGADTSQTDLRKIDAIARAGKTTKPYFWNLGAGYLHYLQKDYKEAAAFYNAAQKQLPAGNRYLAAQYRLLNILLYIDQAEKIDSKTETRLTEQLNWLADLRDKADTVRYLRFSHAVSHVAEALAVRYKKQGDAIKALCFHNETEYYADTARVIAMERFLTKPEKTAFEKAMLRYYPLKVEDLYYHRATLAMYAEKTEEAIALMQQAGEKALFELPGNPFNGRLNDCHDCDHEAPQKLKYTPLSMAVNIKKMKAEIEAGRDVHRNALLLGNVYYNITHHGNARMFYESSIISGSYVSAGLDEVYRPVLTSCAVAEKYYLLALRNAANNEQRAKCTFMAAKCERNGYYNWLDTQPDSVRGTYDDPELPPAGKYFRSLKASYAQSAYYEEVLKECSYFRRYVNTGK